MTTERRRGALPHVGALFDVGTMGSLTDAELLDRFANRGGEASELAFAALVERHGAMVLRVCRRGLGDRDAALDAFQATFLVLATKYRTLRRRESLGSWLYGVAQRVARVARSAAVRRQSHERRKAEETPTMIDDRRIDDRAAVREEFDRLPERYRAALALCDIDDLTHEEAADRLGWPVGTVKSRLARGRAALRDRLARRGLAPTAVAPLLSPRLGAVPPALVNDLARMASKIAAGAPMAGVVPASTSALVQGVRRMMLKDAMRGGIVGALAIGVVAAGLAIAAQEPKQAPAPARPAQGAAEETQICHEVRFYTMSRSGPTWREAFAADEGFRLVSSEPTTTAWALDPDTAHRFLEYYQSRPDANVIQAPKVTTFDGASARLSNVRVIGLDRGPLPARTDEAKEGSPLDQLLSLVGVRQPVRRDLGREGWRDWNCDVWPASKVDGTGDLRDNKAGTVKEGVTVDVRGRRDGDRVKVKVAIDAAHVVALHDAVMPGSASGPARPGEAPGPRKVKLPEVERSRIEGEWTVKDGETLLLSLGLLRSVDEKGKASLAEKLVLVTPRLILMEGEDQHFVIPSLGVGQPRPAPQPASPPGQRP